jgi:hypothetical protein
VSATAADGGAAGAALVPPILPGRPEKEIAMSLRSSLCPCLVLLLIGLSALTAAPAPADAGGEGRPGTLLSLATDYLHHPVELAVGAPGARRVSLDVDLRGKTGRGTLVLDPNRPDYNSFGDVTGVTQMADARIEIRLTAVEVDEPASKGRRLYEVRGDGLRGRLFLVVAVTENGPSRLVVADLDGNPRMVLPLNLNHMGRLAEPLSAE